MPLDLAEFNTAFSRARDKVRNQEGTDVAAEQEKLRALVPDDASEHDRTWTKTLIDRLADPPPPPRQWSALYHEAGRIHASAYPADGTVEEQIAAIQVARRKIWDIADRATKDEEAHIRAMTRVLDHFENELRNPTWPLDASLAPSDDAGVGSGQGSLRVPRGGDRRPRGHALRSAGRRRGEESVGGGGRRS
jgi:hypothetical protein